MDGGNASGLLQRVIEKIKLLLKDKLTYVYGFIALILFIAGYKIYQTKIKHKKNYVDNKEFRQKGEDKATLYFFETEWCPYCKKSKPEWDSFKNSIGKQKINGVELKFVTIDCDDSPAVANRYKVDSYPTIILEYKDQKTLYDAKIEKSTLRTFLNNSL